MSIKDKFFADKFLKNNLIFFTGSMVVAFLNYLYHPILSRVMTVEDFGEIQALISLFLQVSAFVVIFIPVVIHTVANKDLNQDYQKDVSQLRVLALYIVAAVSLSFMLFGRQLQAFFQFQSIYPFFLLAALVFVGVSRSFRDAYLHGEERFAESSLGAVILSTGRIIFSVAFVLLGLRTFGARAGVFVAMIFSIGFLYIRTKPGLKFQTSFRIKFDQKFLQHLRYAVFSFILSATVIFLYSADILVVKHYFSPIESGLYSGVATIARIIFFVTGSIGAVLLPAVKLSEERWFNRALFKKAIFFVFVLGGSGLIFFTIFPKIIITILIGSKYIAGVDILPRLSILMFLISIINVTLLYYLALRDFGIAKIVPIGIFVALILSKYNHDTLMHVVNNFIFSSLVLIVCIVIWVFYKRWRSKIYGRIKSENI